MWRGARGASGRWNADVSAHTSAAKWRPPIVHKNCRVKIGLMIS